MTRDQRIISARAILAYWEDFDRKVPKLSPAEKEWLAGELTKENFGTDRWNRARSSKEYALDRLHDHVGSCIEDVNNLVVVAKDPVSQSREMYYWMRLLNCYTDFDDIKEWLKSAELLDENDSLKFALTFLMSTDSSKLLQHVIVNRALPAAMADTMGWTIP